MGVGVVGGLSGKIKNKKLYRSIKRETKAKKGAYLNLRKAWGVIEERSNSTTKVPLQKILPRSLKSYFELKRMRALIFIIKKYPSTKNPKA